MLADHDMALALAMTKSDEGPGGGNDEREKSGPVSVEDISEEERGILIGDANRLRQVMNNLFSNAIKFTDRGGTITVRTKSLGFCWPLIGDHSDCTPPSEPTKRDAKPLSEKTASSDTAVDLAPLVQQQGAGKFETENVKCRRQMVIRIEVEDSGAGIQKKWVVDNRLFSPYVQTELGRLQGVKGTGLGLALIKNIVRFSGGRFGVKSQFTQDSTFCVELPVGVGPIREQKPSPVIPLEPPQVVIQETNPSQLNRVSRQADNGSSTPVAVGGPNAKPLPTQPNSGDIKPSDQIPTPPSSPAIPKLSKKPRSGPQLFDPPLAVLLVDDDPITRKLMERMLTRNSCKVSTSDNGRTALETALGVSTPCLLASPSSSLDLLHPAATTPYPADNPQKNDIMFVDNQMPIMSGVVWFES